MAVTIGYIRTVHFQIVHDSRFLGIFLWKDKSLETFLLGLNGNRKGPFNGLYGSVQRKLAHNKVLANILRFNLP
mgnify:CR=1 FL=1